MREIDISELRERQLDILAEVDRFCKENEITYYLFAGTLLGAIRHQGYIPWDDDIDIMIPRPDYDRFCRLFTSNTLNLPLTVHSLATSATYALPFAKVSDTSTVLHVESDIVRDIGIYVDVFPLDGWSTHPLIRRVQASLVRLLSNAMLVKHLQRNRKRPRRNDLLLGFLKALLVPVSARRVGLALSSVSKFGTFERSKYAGVIVWAYHESVPKAFYGKGVEVTFEDRTYPAPENIDGVLRILYGNYLKLPPESRRVTNHHFVAYSLD